MRFLCTALKTNRTLRRLVLCGAVQGNDETSELGNAVRSDCHLLELDITGNSISGTQLAALSDALARNVELRTLYAEPRVLDSFKRARRVRRGIKSLHSNDASVTSLNLDNCQLTDSEVTDLAAALAINWTLESLSLQRNKIREVLVINLLHTISTCGQITVLNLTGCLSTSDEATALARCIENSPSLASLNIRDCKIPAEGLVLLKRALVSNDSLTKLRVGFEAAALKPYAYFNDGMLRADSADAEDLKDLLFESVALEKFHRIPELIGAGVDASARDRDSGSLAHSLVLRKDAVNEEALAVLLQAHWHIDEELEALMHETNKFSHVVNAMCQLLEAKWHAVGGNNTIHAILVACKAGSLSPKIVELVIAWGQKHQSYAFEERGEADMTPQQLAGKMSERLGKLCAVSKRKPKLGPVLSGTDSAEESARNAPSSTPSKDLAKGGRLDAANIDHFGEPQVVMAVNLLRNEIEMLRTRVTQLTKANVALEKENFRLHSQQATQAPTQTQQPAAAWYSYRSASSSVTMSTPAPTPLPRAPTNTAVAVANLAPPATTTAKRLFDPPSAQKECAESTEALAMPLSPEVPETTSPPPVNSSGNDNSFHYDEVHVEAEEITYDGVIYFLESSTGKVYRRDGDNAFVGKLANGVLDCDAVDSDLDTSSGDDSD